MKTQILSLDDRAGFTLIELLAVMLILGILVTFLMRSGMSGTRTVQMQKTEAFLQEVGAIAADYESEFGDYPPSTFASDLDPRPSRTNEGIESLVITLWRDGQDWQGREIDDANLGNSDGDSTRKSLTTYSSGNAFEIVDIWENPLAYIHRRDYKKEFTYITWDETGAEVENRVKALLSPKTGDPYRKRSFQLISAGIDGIFGTEDDIANFEIDR